jgi:hypothetical protein
MTTMYPQDDDDKTFSAYQHGVWSMAFLVANVPKLTRKEVRELRGQRFIGLMDTSIPIKGLNDYPTATHEAADVARMRMETDGPPSPEMVAAAARFATALDLKSEGNHWRGECPDCRLPDSLTLTARAMQCEVSCDSGVCSPFDIEASIDGLLSGRGILDFRSDQDFPWKRGALAFEASLGWRKPEAA